MNNCIYIPNKCVLDKLTFDCIPLSLRDSCIDMLKEYSDQKIEIKAFADRIIVWHSIYMCSILRRGPFLTPAEKPFSNVLFSALIILITIGATEEVSTQVIDSIQQVSHSEDINKFEMLKQRYWQLIDSNNK